MNSRNLTNLRLIENITGHVPMASVSKSILFMFLSLLKKLSFNLRLKLLSKTIGVRYDKLFRPEHVFLKRCFSFKTEDLVCA